MAAKLAWPENRPRYRTGRENARRPSRAGMAGGEKQRISLVIFRRSQIGRRLRSKAAKISIIVAFMQR